MSVKRIFKSKYFSLIYIVLVFFFVIRYIHYEWENFNSSLIRIAPVYILLSFALLFLHYLFKYYNWYLITKFNNCNLNLKETIFTKSISEVGKYIPGKIWIYLYLLKVYRSNNISNGQVVICAYYEFIISIFSIIFYILYCLLWNPSFLDINMFLDDQLIILIFVIMLIIVQPKILNSILRIRFIRRRVSLIVDLSFSHIIFLIHLYVINIFIFSLSVYSLTYSLYPDINTFLIFYLGFAYYLASLIGFISIFSPAGLGVREASFIYFLFNLLPQSIIGIVSLLLRFSLLIVEFSLFGISYFHKLYNK